MAANDWSERTRMIVTAAVALVLNVGLGAGFYYVYGIWQEKEKIHKAKVAERNTLKAFVDQNESKPLELKQLTDRFKLQQEKLPDSEQIASLVTDIAKRAQGSNTHMLTFTYGGAGGGDAGAL